ncbi:uncharacterized protein LOC125198433, partial [Salvia hispanica]
NDAREAPTSHHLLLPPPPSAVAASGGPSLSLSPPFVSLLSLLSLSLSSLTPLSSLGPAYAPLLCARRLAVAAFPLSDSAAVTAMHHLDRRRRPLYLSPSFSRIRRSLAILRQICEGAKSVMDLKEVELSSLVDGFLARPKSDRFMTVR